MPPVHLPTAANAPGEINPSPTKHICGPQPEDNRPSAGKPRAGHARPLRVNQQIKNPPLPPQQHQLKILHTNKYIQNDRQKDPGLPLGWA